MSASSFDGGNVAPDVLKDLGAVVFENLGVALVDTSPQQLAQVRSASAGASPILAIEPERICTTSEVQEPSLDYLRGFRDAVRDLAGRLVSGPAGTISSCLSLIRSSTCANSAE